jgi:hypothetical protein
MIIDKDTIRKEILDIKNGRIHEGLKIGIPDIDEHYRFKTGGSLDIFVGHANVGKTTFIIYLMTLMAKKHGLKYAVWSAENSASSIIRKIIEFNMCKPIDVATEDEINESIEWATSHFKVIKIDQLYTYKDVLETLEGIHNAWPIDAALIDPYNALAKPKEEFKAYGSHELDYVIASEFRLWAEKHKVTLMVCMHPVTEAMRKVWPVTHPRAGFPQPLSMSQVEGGSKWANRCQNFYSLMRYTQCEDSWNIMELHVLKVKNLEEGGRPTGLHSPLQFKMLPNNVGYEYSGMNLMNEQKPHKKVLF